MTPRIDMVGIITSRFDEMVSFYTDVLGFGIKMKMDHYAEFENEGVRFALSTNSVMAQATGHASYGEEKKGQALELAFRVASPADVDTTYADLVAKGATLIADPSDKPWGQRAAFFADPDGNIHEVFADIAV